MLNTRPRVGAPTPGACRAPRALLSRRALLAATPCAAPASGPGPASSGPPGPSPSSIDYINPAYFYANPFAPAQGAASSSSAPGSSGTGSHATVLRTIDSVVAAASAVRAAATARAAVAARSASPSSAGTTPIGQAQTRTLGATAAAANASSSSSSSSAASASPATPAPSIAPVQLSAAAAAALADSTFASMDEGDATSTAPGGVRLLVVVGVVLLDDPQWDHETGEPSLQQQQPGAGAAAPDRPVRVLLAQRPVGKSNAGLWEFPGGKVDPGETPEAALVRELREELGITVDPADLAPLTFASHTYPTFHLLMPLYACRRWSGVPVGAEGQAVAWAAAGEVTSFNLTPADIPLVPAVLAAMRHS
ncbi:hypothetical protein HYH02_012435 [Chlamydomonas schloesseri]|uniref:8-oxo-dGTP diphosphatase n=1 Tax=Chlamydomonas schloesseri TaxID=2026947 RepID=A0A835SVR3_9CHLO|nr:hypothetical protein HYH02_012435 [Chlamydomonas schloesseri]|eukprot:KAG2433973.1 hypothetical protein HYH02_012435 [Chlamydomonas schloesseri]